MKKLLLIFLAFISISAATSQTWCPPGAKWHFKRGGNFIGNLTNCDLDLVYTTDTTVLGIPCKKLVATLIGQIWYSSSIPNAPIGTQSFNTYITYQSSDVLFLYNNDDNVFDTVVNFNAAIGDQWLRPGGGINPGGCMNRWAFTVADTSTVNINGFNLKKITTVHTYTVNSSVVTYTNVFLERILFTGGGGEDYYNLFPTYCQPANQVTDIPGTVFRCYEDNGFPLYNPGGNGCKDFWTGIESTEGFNSRLKLYPNPATGVITISLPADSGYEVTLSSLTGESRPLRTSAATNSRIEGHIGSLEPGIYFIRVYEKGRLLGVEKLVKE